MPNKHHHPHPPLPPPPPPAHRPSRVGLFVYEDDTPLSWKPQDTGATDLIWVPGHGAHQRLFWGPGTDDEIRASASHAQTFGLPVTTFFYCFGAAAGQTPWQTTTPEWQAFLRRVATWKAAGVRGLLMDVEDYPGAGPAWWPGSSILPARGSEYQQAAAGAELSFCGSYYKFSGEPNPVLTTPPHRADGLFQFAGALSAPRWLEEETYRQGPYSNVSTVVGYWRPKVAQGFPRAAYVPGMWLRTTEDLRLLPYVGPECFIYTDPGALRDVALFAALRAALKG